jgi:dTDP-4-dehydrorhamnose 3,5-epimerase
MAHGFLVLSNTAEVLHKASNFYRPTDERMIEWNDKTIGIEWQLVNVAKPTVSCRDLAGVGFNLAEVFA